MFGRKSKDAALLQRQTGEVEGMPERMSLMEAIEYRHSVRKYTEEPLSRSQFQELQEAIHTLEVFFEHDGSIARAAAALFIHKNTLQLHLRKIAQRTGYDPRSLRNSAVFYLVIYFYQDLHLLQQSL